MIRWKSIWPKLTLILAGAVAGVIIGIIIAPLSVGPPPPASVVTVQMTKEAVAARTRNPADAISLYAPNAFVRDTACTTRGRPHTWRGVGPDPEAVPATATARTTGFITRSVRFSQGVTLGGAENWVFIRANGTWLISSFTYDLC